MSTPRRRRLTGLVVALMSSMLLLGVAAPAASAHAALLSTTPGDAEILQRSPAEVTLTFGESVGTGLGGLKVLSAAGVRADTGAITQTQGGAQVHLALKPALPEGSYVVVWRVVSADSHPVSGAFTFSVGKPSTAESQLLGRGNLTKLTAAPKQPGIALGLTRVAGFGALVVLLGGALFSLLLWPAGVVRLRRLLLGAAVLETVAAAFAFALEGPYAAGVGLTGTFDTSLLRAVLDVQYGVATATRIGLAAVTVLVLLVLRRGGRALAATLVALGIGWAATWSAAGHAGVGEWEPYAFLFDLSHLVTVSAWVGGLVVLCLGLRGRWSSQESATILPGWSRLATWSVALLVATGVFAGVRQVGEVNALFSTSYGRLLLVKVTLVGLMLLFALVGRSFVRQHYTRPVVAAATDTAVEVRPEPSEEEVAGLRRSVGIEAGLAAIVLAVTALLVNTTPAKAAFAPPYTGRSTAGPLTVAVDIYPARKGLNGLHIYTVGTGGRTVDVAQITGDVVRSDGEKITVYPKHKSLGHYEDLNLVLPATGKWTIELQIRVNDVDSYPSTQTFVVR
ncbi:MAG: putative transport integral rane protein [Frankiales bacterium]|nr:putative transport integral rane protein [Frankiales bacterium]